MLIHIGNTHAKIVQATDAEQAFLSVYLTFKDNSLFWRYKNMRGVQIDTSIRLLNRHDNTFPKGLVWRCASAAREEGHKVDLVDKRVIPCDLDRSADLAWLATGEWGDHQLQGVYEAIESACGIVKCPTGSGKCLGEGTLVLRYDGQVLPVEQITSGMQLMGPDSMPRSVRSTSYGEGALYKVTPVKGEAWVCNEEHMLTLVQTETGEVEDISVREYLLKATYWKHCRKLYQPPHINFTECAEVLPVDPYFVGVWLGDGRKNLDHGVQVSKPDPEIEATCRTTATVWGLELRIDRYKSCPSYRLVSTRGQGNPLQQAMRKLFGRVCRGDQQVEVRIPQTYLTASYADRAALLAGLLDTDGHLAGGYYEIVQQRFGLADDIAFLARSLGFRVTRTTKWVNTEPYERLSLLGDATHLPLRIPRKKPQARQQKKNALRTGFTVQYIGEGEYFGFTLDGDGRFLLGDFTVTHNTEMIIGCIRLVPCHWLVLVPKKHLMHNIANRWMLRGGHQPGLIGDGHCVMDPQRRITVATFASLVAGVRNKEQWAALVLGDCEGLIVDEAHTLPADTFFKIAMATRRAYFRLGFSATPLARSDKRSLCAVGALGPVIFSVDARKLIADGVIARPVIRMVRHTEDTTAKTFAGVYSAVVARSKHRNNLLIKIARIAEKPALLFVKHVAHGKYLTKLLNQLGIQAGFVDGTKETEQRERTIKKLEAGDIDVLVVSNWAQDGTDIPTLRSVINGAAGLSAIATIQRIGRGSRIDKASGKDEFEVWDIFDDGMRASTEQYPVPKPHALSRHAKARKKAYEKEGHSVELIDIDDLSKLEASRGTK